MPGAGVLTDARPGGLNMGEGGGGCKGNVKKKKKIIIIIWKWQLTGKLPIS